MVYFGPHYFEGTIKIACQHRRKKATQTSLAITLYPFNILVLWNAPRARELFDGRGAAPCRGLLYVYVYVYGRDALQTQWTTSLQLFMPLSMRFLQNTPCTTPPPHLLVEQYIRKNDHAHAPEDRKTDEFHSENETEDELSTEDEFHFRHPWEVILQNPSRPEERKRTYLRLHIATPFDNPKLA